MWGDVIINFKQLKSLKTKKGRDELGLFIIEGVKLVAEIPESWNVCAYVCSATRSHEFARSGKYSRASMLTVPDHKFDQLADTVSPQGILAVCEKRTFTLGDILAEVQDNAHVDLRVNIHGDIKTGSPFFLIGENLSDPGNIGTLIRTAAAAGANGVVLSTGSGEIYNPKVIRASAGTCLHIPIVENADLQSVIYRLKMKRFIVLAAHISDYEDSIMPYELNLNQSCTILIGNEAHGLTENTVALADYQIKLPMAPFVESLNASVAGGILLYEIVRQRIKGIKEDQNVRKFS